MSVVVVPVAAPVGAPARAFLPLRNQLLYSASSIGSEALNQSRAAWLLYYYAPPDDSGLKRLLPLGLIGVLLAVLRVVGSLDDLLVGWWSDKTRSRLGRRLPFILVATPFAAILAVLIVTPPANASTAVIAVYLMLTVELFALFNTASGGPYEALLPEIAPRSENRVRLSGLRVYFGVFGAAVGLVLSGPLVDLVGVQAMMIVMCGLFFGCRYLGMAGVWNHVDRKQKPASIPLREALRTTFRNKSFLAFLPTFVLFQTGLGMLTGVLPYYAKAVLRTENEGTWVSILTGVAIVAMLAAIPIFTRIARRRSKREAYAYAMLAAGIAFPVLAIAGFIPGIPPVVQVLLAMALIGGPQAGVYLFPATLLADIADDDANQTGMRREATIYGAQNFVEKTAGALTPLVLAGLLMLGNTASHPLGIRLVGPVASVFILLGYYLFRSYDLPDEVTTAPVEIEPGRIG